MSTLLITFAGHAYPARLRQTSSTQYSILFDDQRPNLDDNLSETIEQVVAEHLRESTGDNNMQVRIQGR